MNNSKFGLVNCREAVEEEEEEEGVSTSESSL